MGAISGSTEPHRDVDALVALAKRFCDRQLFAEAAELVQLGRYIDPKNSGIKLALAEVRRLQRQYRGSAPRTTREVLRERFRRDAIDASHFLGLAELYAAKGENARALECLEIARTKAPASPGLHRLHGRILARRKDYDGAAAELQKALRFNPFDREVAESLGQVQYERRHFREALEATIHGFLLLHEGADPGAERLRRRIRTLRQILGLEHGDLVHLFRQAEDRLHVAFDRLEWRREQFLEEGGLIEAAVSASPAPEKKSGLIDLASRVRRVGAWDALSDEQVIQLAQAMREEFYQRGKAIFAHGDEGQDLFLVERGRITVERSTAYGSFTLGTLGPGALLGEVNFLSRARRSGDAVASEPALVLRVEAAALRRLIEASPDLGMQLYWSFWHDLARKLRATNEQLRTFFDGAGAEHAYRMEREVKAAGREVQVDSEDKIRLFREQGLSRSELAVLAAFLRERRYPAGSMIFEEGEAGREMYVVLEGRVRISKLIAGAGEEALAILERGDFFGEMALVDGEPRSADACAHEGPVTVLGLNAETLKEILSLDPQAALEFLALLCRLLTRRLREIDEKVTAWRILSGAGDAGTREVSVAHLLDEEDGPQNASEPSSA